MHVISKSKLNTITLVYILNKTLKFEQLILGLKKLIRFIFERFDKILIRF